jgi:hypothetical protein
MEKETMPKLAAARDYRDAHGLKFHLEVDGGIYTNTAPDREAERREPVRLRHVLLRPAGHEPVDARSGGLRGLT